MLAHLSVDVCTRKWTGNAAYIVYVTSLATGYFLSFEAFVLFAQTHRHIQWAHMGVCNGQTDFALTLTIWPEKEKLWLPHFRSFCELVEGEENKLTTFSTWTIMLGCNESNIILQQHLCKLWQLWRSNGKAMKKRPTGHTMWPEKEYIAATLSYFCELVEGEESKLTTFSTWTI